MDEKIWCRNNAGILTDTTNFVNPCPEFSGKTKYICILHHSWNTPGFSVFYFCVVLHDVHK